MKLHLAPSAILPLACGLIFALALSLRLRGLDAVPWYPDEGMVAEAAWRLGQGGPYAVGAVRQTAFFPLSTSPLAPLLGAAFQALTPGDALQGLRYASVALGSASAALLVWALWPLGAALAVGAGAVLAWMPLARALQQMGFYHHLGALLAVLALGALLRYRVEPGRRGLFWLCLLSGLAVASAYWLLWLLVLPLLAAWAVGERRDLRWAWGPLLLPLLGVALWSWVADSVGFWGDARELLGQTASELPGRLKHVRPAVGLWKAAGAYPALWLGLAGAAILLWREGRRSPSAWLALWAFLASLEAFRQRQNMEAFAYPLILVLAPLAALCAAGAWALWAWGRTRRPRYLLLAGSFAVLSLWSLAAKPQLDLMRMASAPPWETRRLLQAAQEHSAPGDLVLGQVSFNWALAALGLRVSDLDQAAAAAGTRGLFLRGDLPPERFVFTPSLQAAKLLIVSPHSYGISFAQPQIRRLGLQAEMDGWSQVWSDSHYAVYGNPGHGFPRARYAERILRYYNLYDAAAQEAFDEGRFEAARFAALQSLAYTEGDKAAREVLLKKAEDALKQTKGRAH